MKKKAFFASLPTLLFLLLLISCEKEQTLPEEEINPFDEEELLNGFSMGGTYHKTPNAIIEMWGENIDSMSSDYDISFTDGTFDQTLREVKDYNILLYLDANSPSLDDFSPGTYSFENTTTREPWNIIEAYVLIKNPESTMKYPVFDGEATISRDGGYFLIEYNLKVFADKKETVVTGRYSGKFTLIDQTSL